MKLETFFNNFELLADAPNGVQKLRELILQLAVRGKLVPQNPADEPAYVLLDKIKAEKERLIEENKIRKDKPLLQIDLSELPYELPKSWNWVRLGDIIFSITGGGTPSKNNPQFWGGNIPWASVKDLKRNKYLETTIDFITKIGIQKSSTNLIPKGRVIICTRMGLGKIAINSLDVAINQDLKAIELADEIDVNYFYNFYLTQNIVGTGVTVSGIRQSEILNFIVPIPPLNEQKRIVAKVDQLMALCDELETRQRHRHENCVRLNNAAIAQLLTTREPNDFSKHWQSICNNFDLLYSAPENIGKLRQAIIQLAVQGKLVAQDSTDEPAFILLEKIKAEKEQLIKEKKIRRSKPLPPIEINEIPFELSEHWEWIRLGEVGDWGAGATPDRKNTEYYGGSITWFKSGELNDGYIRDSEERITELALQKCSLRLNRPEDVLIAMYGATIGKVAILEAIATTNQAVCACTCFKGFYNRYLFILLKAYKNYFLNQGAGGAQPNISREKIIHTVAPLPPFEEQKRIVTKVDQLMKLCNELESKLIQSRADSEKLMDAAVRQLLEV